MTIDGWIARAARETPDKIAIDFPGQPVTYGRFADLIHARAAQLHEQGIGKGDRIAWLGFNTPEVFVLLFAAARLGAMLVPLNWRLADAELADILTDCAPKVLFHDDKAARRANALAPMLASSVWGDTITGKAPITGTLTDPLLIVYTSGSTGQPKGAVLAQEALVANAAMSVAAHGLAPDDRVLNVLPLFHVGGLNILPTPAFSIGATVALHEVFHPAEALAALATVQTAIVVPTVLQAIIAQPGWTKADLSRLRALSIGSTDVPRGLIDTFHGRGIPLIQVYGATETAPFAIYQTFETAIPTAGSIGQAGSKCDIRLVRPDGREANTDEPGEIWVKGPNTLLEYWRNPVLTQQAITDGWFHTGDVASRDDKGNYWFTDRIKHVIISGGENIYPAEIERLLRDHPEIDEVAVVGQPHPRWGETPVAVIGGDCAISGDEVLAILDDKLARFKRPARVIFVDALPRNAMGKIVAAEVRALIENM